MAKRRAPRRGQSLVEFAIVLPLLLVLFGGAVQYGVVFAAKNSLTQVARDTARWAATQTVNPCNSAAAAAPAEPLTHADQVATASSLIGYTSGTWASGPSGNFTAYANNTPLPASPPNTEGVEVVWSYSSGACPTSDNTTAAFVTIRLTHAVPLFIPGLQYLPSFGTCDGTGCHVSVSATSMFRMEPPTNP